MSSRAGLITRLLPAAVAVLLAVPLPASAQIGGAINKAKKKATEAAAPTTPATGEKGCTSAKFDKDVIELTPERIDRVIKGVQATRATVGPSGLTPTQMSEKAKAAFDERDKLMAGKEDQAARYTDAEGQWQSCHAGVLDSLNRQHGPEAQQRLMQMAASQNASSMQAVVEAQSAAVQAQAAGDTVAYKKHMSEYWKALGVDFAKDTATADRLCKRPVKPAWLIRADSLGLLGNKLVDDARATEQRSAAKGAEAAGMGERQFYIAQERIAAFVQSDGNPTGLWCYGPAEREALKAKMKELKALDLQ